MKYGDLSTTPQQLTLDLEIAAEREVDGVGMGVLTDGTPFLTLRGLARLCGVDHSVVIRTSAAWLDSPLKPRERRIRELVREQNADDSAAFLGVQKNGIVQHAVPAAVCMAFLEYYAFEGRGDNEQALKSYRTLARKGFSDFIYAQVGYNPENSVSVAWRQFHDRVSLNFDTVPDGYFSVFREVAGLMVTLINQEADLGEKFIPDISVGSCWGKHWRDNNLDNVYGPRLKYEHSYPDYFPQAESNPQQPFCYPDEALPEFREWLKNVYNVSKLPGYMNGKVRSGHIPAPNAKAALEALKPKQIAPLKH
ncbi:hypothetical protein ABWH92_12215 [Ahrensia marina]|uniref:hypothetical protein n=1 Tax=Ahrensia marina TaxID=1514904 RepID=UPI0035D065A0